MIPGFAGLIARKLVELAKVAKINEEDEKIFKVTWGGDLMQVALQMFRDPVWRQQYRFPPEYGPAWKRQKTHIPLTTDA